MLLVEKFLFLKLLWKSNHEIGKVCGWGLNFGALGKTFELENKRIPVELDYFCESKQIHVGHSLYGINENQELISHYIWDVENITPKGIKFEKVFGNGIRL